MLLHWDSGCSNVRLDPVTKQTFYIQILFYKTYQIDSLSQLMVSTIVLDTNKNIVPSLGWVIFKAFFIAVAIQRPECVINIHLYVLVLYVLMYVFEQRMSFCAGLSEFHKKFHNAAMFF